MKSKNILSTVFALFICISILQAQDAIDKYFYQYTDNPDFTSIVVSSKMFELFANIQSESAENTDDDDFKEAIRGLKGIRILSYDRNDFPDAKIVDYKSALKKVGPEYEVLMSIDDKDEKLRFYILENNEEIKELFMIVGGKGNLFLMSLVGDIDLARMSRLSKKMDIGGMNYLENLDEEHKTK